MTPYRDAGRAFPVTHVQEERFRSGGGRHFAFSGGLALNGPYAPRALVAAVHLLIQRHPYLRAVFFTSQDGSVMSTLTRPQSEFLIEHTVPPGVPDDERRQTALKFLRDQRCMPFDLRRGPLFRVVIVHVDDSLAIVEFTMDHILADGYSRSLLQRDLVALYREAITGEPSDLPILEKSFPDFCAQEREFLSGDSLKAISQAWAERLRGVDPIPPSRLADDDAPGGQPRVAFAVRSLGRDRKAELGRLCSEIGVSAAMISAAALTFAVRTMRTADEDEKTNDVAVMASAANRVGRQWRDVVGYFATPNVLRTDLAGAETIQDVLLRVRATILHALRYQRMPHSLLITQLKPSLYGVRHVADADAAPRYVNFDCVKQQEHPHELVGGTKTTPFHDTVPGIPRGGLRVVARDRPDDLVLHVDYRADHYSSSWVARFADIMHAFLVSACDDARTPLERLNAWNPGAR